MHKLKLRAWVRSEHADDWLMVGVCYVNFEEGVILADNGLQYREYRLMLDSGLRDKNGTEIYQGDILEFNKPGLKPYRRAVMWHMGGLHLVCELGGFPDNDDDFSWLDHAHIAGTIHDNPDLLEVAEK